MKCAIYCRVSTTEQEPSRQIEGCQQIAINKGYDIVSIHTEKLSGYKQIDRPEYNKIKEMARKGEIQAVIVWALDRWVRNRDTLIEDVSILRTYGCKLHSVRDAWLESINIEGSLGKTIQEFLLGLIGSLSEMESQIKSERVKLAYKTHKGKKWGRRPLPDRVIEDVINLKSQGKSIREITKSVQYYDKNKNLKYLSVGTVHKIIAENKGDLDT